MSNARNLTAGLLLGLLTVVGAGGAVLGVAMSPKAATLPKAVTNTLGATNYSEVLDESTSQGKQTDYLTFQAPDRLGGYIESGDKRTYVVVIGTVEYQSLTVSSGTPMSQLKYYRQQSPGAADLDPAHNYLPYAQKAKHVTSSGGTYSFTLTKSGEVGTFVYTVSGQYVSEFTLGVKNASVQLVISQVGSSPSITAPPASQVVTAPSTGGTG